MSFETLSIGNFEEILLIRHGSTAANVAKKYSGLTDLPLSAIGCDQIKLLKQQLVLQGLSYWFDEAADIRLLCSPLTRCKQTKALLWPDRLSMIVPDLIETDFGSWEGLTYDQLKSDPYYRNWLDAPPQHKPAPPNGESGEAVLRRLKIFLDNELNLSKQLTEPKRLAVVTHGGVIMYLMMLITGNSEGFYNWQLKPGQAWLLGQEGYRKC